MDDMTNDFVLSEGDVFTSRITEKVMPRYHRRIGYRLKGSDQACLSIRTPSLVQRQIQLASYSSPSYHQLRYSHYTTSSETLVRLGLIMVFSALLAGCLAILTNASASRIEWHKNSSVP